MYNVLVCPIGTYQELEAQMSCRSCPEPRSTNSTGSFSLEACICPSTMFDNSRGGCIGTSFKFHMGNLFYTRRMCIGSSFWPLDWRMSRYFNISDPLITRLWCLKVVPLALFCLKINGLVYNVQHNALREKRMPPTPQLVSVSLERLNPSLNSVSLVQLDISLMISVANVMNVQLERFRHNKVKLLVKCVRLEW